MNHARVRRRLYEFVRNELPGDERRLVQQHLDGCASCQHELRELERTLELLSPAEANPAVMREDAFWNELAGNVERAIDRREASPPSPVQRLIERLRTVVALRPAYVYATGASFAVLLLAVLFFLRQPVADERSMTKSIPSSEYALVQDDAAERMSEYLRKSRTLFVGIVNMKTDPSSPLDLSAERQLSRSLVHEARYLKQRMIGSRSAKLVNDMEKILIELANLESANDLPNVELIRGGIAQENLLFKIRMAEATLDTAAAGTNEDIY